MESKPAAPCLFFCLAPNYDALEKALISLYGPDDALEESGYFNYSITLGDIFRLRG
ncbi:MAG: hypothetical protein GY950_01800 [bacterium]|nr:hypothetical protein [bacterium]